jgi:hypothetical protein
VGLEIVRVDGDSAFESRLSKEAGVSVGLPISRQEVQNIYAVGLVRVPERNNSPLPKPEARLLLDHLTTSIFRLATFLGHLRNINKGEGMRRGKW